MIGVEDRICVICARSGSKEVPDKNIRRLLGRPLLAYAIESAEQSQLFDVIAVSSDSEEYLRIGENHGAKHLIHRPASLATDGVTKLPAVRHCVEEVENTHGKEFQTIVDLDVTSPLRTAGDVVGAVSLLEESGCSSVITGAPARRSPYYNLVELRFNGVARVVKPRSDVTRRQNAPACYDMNAAVYAWKRTPFMACPSVFYDDTKLYVMPQERSLDIDSELDLAIVEALMLHQSGASVLSSQKER